MFDSMKMNTMNLKNRFVRSTTCENMVLNGGHLKEKLYKVYENLAQGQVGPIITGNALVLEERNCDPTMMGIYNDSFRDEYKKLTDGVTAIEANLLFLDNII